METFRRLIMGGLILVLTIPLYAQPRPIAHFPMDGNGKDVSGQFSATAYGVQATADRFGNPYGAMYFNGKDSYLEMASPLSIFSGSFTISMWVKIPQDASGRVGVLFGDYDLSGGLGVNLEIHSKGQIRYYWNGSPDLYGKADLRDGRWHEITFVRDKAGGTEKVFGYIDGILDIEWEGSSPDKTARIGHRIGRDSRNGDTAFEGAMDDLKIYNVVAKHGSSGGNSLPHRSESENSMEKSIFDNWNISSVQNLVATQFSIKQPTVISKITNYHWNYGRGQAPGTIALVDQFGNFYGPWECTGTPGQGGVPNANWECEPNLKLEPGVYTIIDSDPSTWSQNGQSGGKGFSKVYGY